MNISESILVAGDFQEFVAFLQVGEFILEIENLVVVQSASLVLGLAAVEFALEDLVVADLCAVLAVKESECQTTSLAFFSAGVQIGLDVAVKGDAGGLFSGAFVNLALAIAFTSYALGKGILSSLTLMLRFVGSQFLFKGDLLKLRATFDFQLQVLETDSFFGHKVSVDDGQVLGQGGFIRKGATNLMDLSDLINLMAGLATSLELLRATGLLLIASLDLLFAGLDGSFELGDLVVLDSAGWTSGFLRGRRVVSGSLVLDDGSLTGSLESLVFADKIKVPAVM